MPDDRLQDVARVIAWARERILTVRRVTTDPWVKVNLRAIAFSLHPKLNPRIRFLEATDGTTRTTENTDASVEDAG